MNGKKVLGAITASICVIITLFAVTLLGTSSRDQIIQSRSGLYIAKLLDRADRVMPEELHEFLDPYLNRLDERLDGTRSDSEAESGPDDFDRLEDWLESGQGGPASQIGVQEASEALLQRGQDLYQRATEIYPADRDSTAENYDPGRDSRERYQGFQR